MELPVPTYGSQRYVDVLTMTCLSPSRIPPLCLAYVPLDRSCLRSALSKLVPTEMISPSGDFFCVNYNKKKSILGKTTSFL